MICCAPFAFIFNKKPFIKSGSFNPVDDGKWTDLIAFALQFYDFGSDVNLAISAWTYGGAILNPFLFLLAQIGCTAFVILPYSINLFIASRIKKMIGNNPSAQSYFESKSGIFVFLVVMTGGVYPALCLISSNIFGLGMLSSGLSKFELRRMRSLKVFGTVVLENLPQLIFQCLFAAA